MEEFAEIEPGGFKIEFTPYPNGGCVVSMEPTSLTGPLIPNRFVRTVSVVVSNDGTVLEMDIWPNRNKPICQVGDRTMGQPANAP
jgi:hypothetical protein